MTYIDNNLVADERILFRTKKHIIIFLWPLLITVVLLYALNYIRSNLILNGLQWTPVLVGILIWAYVGIEYLTSEFAITNKRLMMREGFFYRHTNEVRLATISQVNVEQSLLGQMLNYGTVSINTFGAYDVYTLISQAPRFQKQVNAQLDHLTTVK
jgi:uncharacterized membrane protein YdbT with pleckstrin-like domain